MTQTLAVVDIGSNTFTLAVYRGTREGGLDRIAQEGAALKLIRQIAGDGRLPASAIKATVDTIRRFRDRAAALGATTIEVVATSAVRDAANQEELLAAVRGIGVPIRILDGESEGVCAVVSAVNMLPLTEGFVVDQGGGSMQIAHVTTRRARQVVSLPLGALRLTDRFFASDPPDAAAVTALRRHLQTTLSPIRWFNAGSGGTLVGVGGSLRALAKIDRRLRTWPLSAGHGYVLTVDAIEAIWEQTSRAPAAVRAAIPGLASHRVETVAAAAMTFLTLMRAGGFDTLTVSSYGIREGVAFRRLFGEEADGLVPDVRLAGLTSRFPKGRPVLAARRLAEAADLDPAVAFAAAWLLPLGADAVARLRDAPLPGYTQAEVLAVIDVLTGGLHVLASRPRERLRLVAEVALADPLARVEQGRLVATVDERLRARLGEVLGVPG